jgi:hypothetical protein
MPKGPLLPRRANLRGAATGSQMGVRHGAMNPAGKYAATCGLIKVGQWFHSNSKYCLGDKGREQFLQRNCLDRGGLSRWFLGAGSSGNPTPTPKGPLGPRGALRFPGAGVGAPAPNQASSHAFSALEAYGCGPECRNSRSARNTLL